MVRLKVLPEDFVVKEIPLVRPSTSQGRYLYFLLRKKGKNTIDVIRDLARILHLPDKHVGFAGSKDKQAVTEQVCSVTGVARKQLEVVRIPDVQMTVLGYGTDPISLGDLIGNTFTITVRDLKEEEVKKIKPSQYVPNYFDEQRFGERNIVIGKAMITKNFAEVVRLGVHTGQWNELKEYRKEHPTDSVGALRLLPSRLLRMYVNAYQSYLWNETVAEYLRKKGKVIKEVKYRGGFFVFVDQPEKFTGLQLPMVGFGSLEWETYPLVKQIIDDLLQKEGITRQDFIIPQLPELSLEGGLRSVMTEVKEMVIGTVENDELQKGKKKVTISFTLPKGSYATMVMKWMFSEQV